MTPSSASPPAPEFASPSAASHGDRPPSHDSAALPDGAAAAAARALTLSVFDEVFRSLSHGESQNDTLLLLTEKARLLTDCVSTAIGLLDADRETLTFVAASGHESQEMLGSRLRLTDTIAGQTALTGEPYLAYRPRPRVDEEPSITSAAVVPIFDEGRPIGALAALNKAYGAPFGGDDLMALTSLAAAASIALRNTRLQSDSQRHSRELSLLYDAVRNVSGQLSSQEVLRTVVEQASDLLENSAVVVFLTNDERTHLYIAEDVGLDGSPDIREVTLSGETGVGAAVLGTSLPVYLAFAGDDGEDADAVGQRSETGVLTVESPFPALGARAGVAAAIRAGDAVHGMILVLTGQPAGVYTAADANLLSALASQAAVAMENSWLYEDATRRAEEAATLYEISQAVTSTLRLPQVLDRVADAVLSLLGVDKFALFLHDPSNDRLQMVVQRGLPPGAAERVRPATGQGIPGWVLEFETPTAVQDVAADHRNASAPLHTEGIVSMTGMPLQIGSSTIGVLCALSSRRRLFTVAEMELLYTIANQAAIAIENARMYADVRHTSQELRKSFQRVARALGSAASPQTVPELIVSLTQEMTGADSCAFYSVRPSSSDGRSRAPEINLEASAGFRLSSAQRAAAAGFIVSPDSPTVWVGRKGRSLAIPDIEEDERFRISARRLARGKVGAYLGVPLRTGDREVLGVLEIYMRTPHPWRAEEVRLLIAFATQATIAYQNARLIEEGRRASARAAALGNLLQILTGGAPVDAGDAIQSLRAAYALRGGIAALRRDAADTPWSVAATADMAPEAALRLCATSDDEGETAVLRVTSKDQTACLLLERGGDGKNGLDEGANRSPLSEVMRVTAERLASRTSRDTE